MSEPDEYEQLDALVRETCAAHGLLLFVAGLARKTYDIHIGNRRASVLAARVESFATTSGEIGLHDDRALPFAEELGARLEETFGLNEAVIVRRTDS